jgi:hypothetical protein
MKEINYVVGALEEPDVEALMRIGTQEQLHISDQLLTEGTHHDAIYRRGTERVGERPQRCHCSARPWARDWPTWRWRLWEAIQSARAFPARASTSREGARGPRPIYLFTILALLVALCLGPLFAYLPRFALAAVVIMGVQSCRSRRAGCWLGGSSVSAFEDLMQMPSQTFFRDRPPTIVARPTSAFNVSMYHR